MIACDGMAATSHPLATLAAIDTLRAGGNAADAAVAAVRRAVRGRAAHDRASAAIAIAWCRSRASRCGAITAPAAPAPRRPTEALRAKGMTEIGNSIHAVTVPGALDAWEAILKAHGRFGLDRALQPAIKYAEGGFPVAARVAWDWGRYVGKLKADAGAAKHYLFNGAAPKEGDVIRLPALAATLKTIAAKGARAFYEGEIAEDMAATVAARGSFLTAEDFAAPPRRCGRADLDQLSRPRSAGNSAERAGAHRAGDAQHPREFRHRRRSIRSAPSVSIWCWKRRGSAYAVRDTHIADAAHMRIAGRRSARQGLGQETRGARSIMNKPRQAAEGADAGQQNGLSHRGR